MPERLLRHWKGVPSTKSSSGGDYSRACKVNEYLGPLSVGPSTALVLGEGGGMQASWWPLETGGILVQWGYAASELAVEQTLTRLPLGIFKERVGEIDVRDATWILFDSAYAGSEATNKDHLAIKMPKGRLVIEEATYEPDEETQLIVHLFRRQPARVRTTRWTPPAQPRP